MWSELDLRNALSPLTLSLEGGIAKGISIDTRTLHPGDLYIAIQGDTHDGHRFCEEALQKGAAGVVVSRPTVRGERKEILVNDSLAALQRLAAYARERTRAKVIAITGSAGKTTTKEMVRHLFSLFGKTVASKASYNNHWGVPLTLSQIPQDSDFAVVEIGMNHPGEIAPLSRLARPHAAIITAIAEAHIGHMGTLQAIAQEKASIISGIEPGGLLIYNRDHAFESIILAMARAHGVNVTIPVSSHDLIGASYTGDYVGQVLGEEVAFRLPLSADHLARNALLALTLIQYWGLTLSEAAHALSTLPLLKGRGLPLQIPGGGWLLDDSYNANLASMKAGLSVMKRLPGDDRIAILGEMLELGDKAEEIHLSLIPYILEAGVTKVYAVGDVGMQALFHALPESLQGGLSSSIATLMPEILLALPEAPVIFIKGSKGSAVSQAVEDILNFRAGDTALPRKLTGN